ncbi:hypothetical protein FRC12_002241 [Ceratobasidium sp. 428]|nr:hypothetical protein FRC12_002241 [Ceratobasidium sp. 428]
MLAATGSRQKFHAPMAVEDGLKALHTPCARMYGTDMDREEKKAHLEPVPDVLNLGTRPVFPYPCTRETSATRPNDVVLTTSNRRLKLDGRATSVGKRI